MPTTMQGLTEEQMRTYRTDGYVIVRALLEPVEVDEIAAYFRELGERGESVEPYFHPDPSSPDPLKRYPRVLFPHRFGAIPKKYLLDARIHAIVSQIFGEEPAACQSMYYFKPPGGRGQAFHQDNFYIDVQPEPSLAAWMAIDRADEDNGCLWMCPGTHEMDIVCPDIADESESFTTHVVQPPGGVEPVPAVLDPGDAMFFNGKMIHGSWPNHTKDRWRGSYIGHYMPMSSLSVRQSFLPAVGFDGRDIDFKATPGDMMCGEEFPSAFWDDLREGRRSSPVPSA